MEQAPTPTAAATMPSQPVEKKRYEWIDNARIVAAFLIMYVHFSLITDYDAPYTKNNLFALFLTTTLNARVPFFLILAGYFLSRNITWKKAFDRFLWLLIPFLVWNLIYFILLKGELPLTVDDFSCLIGIKYVFSNKVCIHETFACSPIIGPSWFLRDIMLMSLLTPVLIRFKKYLFPFLLVLASGTNISTQSAADILFAPANVMFYLLGVALSDFKISDIYRIFNKSFIKYGVAGILFAVYNSVRYPGHWLQFTFCGTVFGALLIGYSGYLIERYLPTLSKHLAPCAPVCFLVFMLHMPVFTFLKMFLPHAVFTCKVSMLIPVLLFILLSVFYFAMKKYAPFLLPYLAHVKVPRKVK